MIAWLLLSIVSIGLGTETTENSNPENRVLRELETSFQEDFLAIWYPRVKDEENGGFLSDFDAQWRPSGDQDKFIVSQARHIWTTSQLSMFIEGDVMYRELAEHGFRYLRDVMWDSEQGGFHSRFSQRGELKLEDGKSAYGNAFAIYGLASYYELSGDAEALELAKKTFYWLEEKSWDREHGGYVNCLNNDGSWRERAAGNDGIAPWGILGLKDYNSSIHLLEAFTALYRVYKDDLVRRRLEDMLVLVRDRFTTEKGYIHLYFLNDWTPLGNKGKDRAYIISNAYFDHVSWGHDVETAFLMLEASRVLGPAKDKRTMELAKRMVDHALATGWDSTGGGLPDAGYYFESSDKCEVIRDDKAWWSQAEGLNAFLMMSQLYPEEQQYYEAFLNQWEYIKNHLIDHENGGWYLKGLDTKPETRNAIKTEIWKATYHSGRAYMNCIRMLRGEFELTQSHSVTNHR